MKEKVLLEKIKTITEFEMESMKILKERCVI